MSMCACLCSMKCINCVFVHKFSLVPVLIQFIHEKSQVTFPFWAKLRVRPSGLSEVIGRSVSEEDISSDSRVVDDLPGSAVSCHSSLRCAFICAHLQANDAFSFDQLFFCEFSLVLLSLSAHIKKQKNKTTHLSLLFVTTELKKSAFYQRLFTRRLRSCSLLMVTHDGYIVSFFRWLGFRSHRQTSNWL